MKWNHDFDPDIDRFASLFDHLNVIADSSVADVTAVQNPPSNIDVGMPLNSLLVSLAQEVQTTAF